MIRANAVGFTYSYGSLKLKKTLKPARSEEIIFTLVTSGECSWKVEVNKIPSTK